MEELWTAQMLAEKLHVKKATISQWMHQGKLIKGVHYLKPGGQPLFVPSQIEKFIGFDQLKELPSSPSKQSSSKTPRKKCRFNL